MSTTKRAVLFLFSKDDGGRKELMRDRSRRFPEKLEIDYGTVLHIPAPAKADSVGKKCPLRTVKLKRMYTIKTLPAAVVVNHD